MIFEFKNYFSERMNIIEDLILSILPKCNTKQFIFRENESDLKLFNKNKLITWNDLSIIIWEFEGQK